MGAPWAEPNWRTEWKVQGGGDSLESLHFLHKCLKRVMPTLHLPCPSPSYNVYCMFSHPVWRGALLDNGLCMFSWVHFGAGIRALFLEGLVIHSPAFANVHRELVVATSSQQRIVFFSLLSLPHSLHLGFELELETLFFFFPFCITYMPFKK